MIRRKYLSFRRLQWSWLLSVRIKAEMLRMRCVMAWSGVRVWFLVIVIGKWVVMAVVIVGRGSFVKRLGKLSERSEELSCKCREFHLIILNV